MASISAACVQNESCTAANDSLSSSHLNADRIMCVASNEWIKLGGKPWSCFRLLTGSERCGSDMLILWRFVRIIRDLDVRYGWTTGIRRGFVQITLDLNCKCSSMLNESALDLGNGKREPSVFERRS